MTIYLVTKNCRFYSSYPATDSTFRYLAICYPFKHKDFTGRIVTIVMIGTYVHGTVTNSPGLLQVPTFQTVVYSEGFFLEVANFQYFLFHCMEILF